MLVMAIYNILKTTKIEPVYLFFFLYLILNLLINNPPAIFNAWMRLALFFILLLCISSVLKSDYLTENRYNILIVVLWVSSMLSVASFFCRFLGINYMFGGGQSYNSAGTFAGLFLQSMMLGPIAGVSTVFMSYQAYNSRKKKTSVCYILAALACLSAVFFSASRSSLLCSVAGILVMLMKVSKQKGTFIKIIFIVALVAVLTFPLWRGVTADVMAKQSANIEMGGMLASRDVKWSARIHEFEHSPLFGIGFAAVDPSLDDVGTGGVIEPGSSWLAVLSMTGIVGCLFFIIIIVSGFWACSKKKNNENALLSGLLTLFSIHMLAEGYVFAGGGFLCFLLWITISCCYDRKYAK